MSHARMSAALLCDEPYDGPLNVASGTPHTVLDMAVALGHAFGADAPTPIVAGGARLGDVRHVFASTDRAKAAIGFSAAIGFDEGMHEFASAPLRAQPIPSLPS